MARTAAARHPAAASRHPDLLDAEQFAEAVGIGRKQTVTDLAADGHIPGAAQVAGRWLFNVTVFWEWLAGPGIPYGEIVTARELARRLGADDRAIRRSRKDPGTPGRGLPGRRLGDKIVLFAVPAVETELGWPLGSIAGESQPPGTVPDPEHGPATPDRSPADLDVTGAPAARPASPGGRRSSPRTAQPGARRRPAAR